MKLKWSNYNISYESENGNDIILTNSLNNNVYKLKKELIEKINKFIDEKDVDNNIKAHILNLYIDHFLVDADLNEFDLFKSTHETNKINATMGNIYFIPSFDCDFRCTYCILGNNVNSLCSTRMSKDDVIKTADWICDTTSSLNIKDLQILLFGGEPLLSHKENLLLMNKLNGLTKSFSVNYSLITNGYSLTTDLLEELIDNKLSSVQITLDGMEDVHNIRRPYIDGSGTFKQIIENILTMAPYDIKIIIRINVDEKNCSNIIPLLEYMVNLKLNETILLHIVPVDPSSYSKTSGYSTLALSKYHEIYKYAFANNFNVQKWRRFCSISSKMNFSIDSHGNIYPCPNFVGDEHYKIADIHNGFTDKYYKLLYKKLDDNCIKCNYIGLCNGGCLSMKILEKTDKCIFYQTNFMIDKSYTLAKYESPNLNILRLGKFAAQNSKEIKI